MKKIRFTAVLLSALMLLALLSACGPKKSKTEDAGLSDVKDEMYSAEYWTAKYKKSDKAILGADDIAKLNTKITEGCAGMEDIMAYPVALTGTQLTRYLGDWDINAFLETELYNAGDEAVNIPAVYDENGEVSEKGDDTFLSAIQENMALDLVADNNETSFAISAFNTSLHKFPSADPVYAAAGSEEDIFRIKSISVGEPMVVLHTSRDLAWLFVQTREARGWIQWDSVISVDKNTWINYVRADRFIVVTEPAITLTAAKADSEPVTLYMGTVLPLYDETPAMVNGQSTAGCYVARMPAHDENGNETFTELLIPKNCGVSEGWLEYTPENIVKTAFKLMGQKLNPAGINNGWDGNSFYSTVYRCFGIYLPLTIAEQAIMPGIDTDLTIESDEGIEKVLDGVYPGALLYSDSSAYMYLGSSGGKYYILHPAEDFFVNSTRFTANCVILTSLDILRADGATYLNSIEKIKKLELESDKK